MRYDFSALTAEGGKTAAWFSTELGSMRTGRATPAIIENVRVEAYGSRAPLKTLASISVEDARTMRVEAWDGSVLKDIERALVESSLGGQVLAEKHVVRVVLPEITEERRAMLDKLVSEKLEEARIALREARDAAWKRIQEAERNGALSEDDKYRCKDEMEKIVAGVEEKLRAAAEKKRTEISQ